MVVDLRLVFCILGWWVIMVRVWGWDMFLRLVLLVCCRILSYEFLMGILFLYSMLLCGLILIWVGVFFGFLSLIWIRWWLWVCFIRWFIWWCLFFMWWLIIIWVLIICMLMWSGCWVKSRWWIFWVWGLWWIGDGRGKGWRCFWWFLWVILEMMDCFVILVWLWLLWCELFVCGRVVWCYCVDWVMIWGYWGSLLELLWLVCWVNCVLWLGCKMWCGNWCYNCWLYGSFCGWYG